MLRLRVAWVCCMLYSFLQGFSQDLKVEDVGQYAVLRFFFCVYSITHD